MCDICDNIYTLSNRQRLQLARELNIDDLVNKALDALYESGKIDRKTKKELFLSHYKPLQQAVEEGYGKRLAKIEYGTPNYEFLKQLQTNTAVFAMFKNHAAIKEMAALLKDTEGNLRSKESFIKEALKKDATYRITRLDAEYDTAVRQARMASTWKRFQETKHLYPCLKYMLTKAAIPDKDHLAFVGIVRKIDDTFWLTHYPPNRWRCQCSVEQTDEEETDIPGNLPALADDFKFNSGILGQVFDTAKCDYAKAASPKEAQKIVKEAKNAFNADVAASVPYQVLYKSKRGGSVETHPLSFNEPDIDLLQRTARSLANEGKDFRILPGVGDEKLRKALLPAELAAKPRTPDYLDIKSGKLYDLKKLEGSSKNTIKRPFSDIKGQADNVIISVPESWPFSQAQTKLMINKKMRQKEMKDFGDVWVDFKGKWLFNPHKNKRD